MIINENKVLFVVGILGFIAAGYMLISNIFFNKDFSSIAIAAGFIYPLSFTLLNSNKKKSL